MPARPRFFFRLTLAFLAIAVAGFSTTYLLPLARGAMHAPWVVHLHGVLVFGWLGLLIGQSLLVQRGRIAWHRRIGPYAAAWAAAMVASGVAIGVFATRRDLAAGGGDFALGQFVNILIEMALFGGLVAAAIVLRRDRDSHKRLLMVATISALGPAWLRFRHFWPVDDPFVVYSIVADSVLLVAIARDWHVERRLHRAYVVGGGVMVAVHAIELAFMTSPAWVAAGRWLLGA